MELNASIRNLRKSLGLTQEQFANQLNIKRSLVGAYEEGRAEPRLELLYQMASLGGIDLETLLTGKSPTNEAVLLRNELSRIPLVPVKAAAGYLRGYGDAEKINELPTISLPNFRKGNYRAFEIQGDSMLPIQSGTIIVCEQIENISKIKNGKTYVLVTQQDGIVYKRVYSQAKDGQGITLKSDNPSYKAYSISPESVLELWSAKAYISTQFPDP